MESSFTISLDSSISTVFSYTLDLGGREKTSMKGGERREQPSARRVTFDALPPLLCVPRAVQ